MTKFMAAAIQMDTQDDKKLNLQNAVKGIEEAVAKGAKLIALPETMNYIGRDELKQAEPIPDGPTFKILAEQAKKYGIWIHGGSIYEIKPRDNRPYNATMLISPEGNLVAKYRKLHPFDVIIINGPFNKESDRICPGNEIVTVDTVEVGHLGLSICYDIRFPEIYRLMAMAGAQVLLAPSNFTINTGRDHWEILLRTRALENECYMIAPAQCGIKPNFQANGNAMIIDPWGRILARASTDKPEVITAEIDLDYVDCVRKQLFTLANRRPDVYHMTTTTKRTIMS